MAGLWDVGTEGRIPEQLPLPSSGAKDPTCSLLESQGAAP